MPRGPVHTASPHVDWSDSFNSFLAFSFVLGCERNETELVWVGDSCCGVVSQGFGAAAAADATSKV